MRNNPYKLLIMDIDGTLVGDGGAISPENREALAKVRGSGVQVSLSTGRSSLGCSVIIDQLELDGYHIFFDGALVSHLSQEEEVFIQPLSQGVVKEAVEFAHLHGIDFELYSKKHYFAERETWSTDAHSKFFSIEPTIIDFSKIPEQEEIIKGGMVSRNPEEEARAREFCRHFEGSLHSTWVRTPTYLGVDFINIVASGVSKGKALEALTSHLGLDLSEVIAIGDGTNDISLLSTAGMAVAMGNAPDEVKAVADHITLDVDHNGMAVAIDKFLL
ncbi:Cof-type HAD-IIB family hydrolase [Chloroflexota bacterium]